jgi:hypothetical protein
MRIVLKVSSNNEYGDGECEFAVVDLTLDPAALALRRIGRLQEQKSLDPDIDETYYRRISRSSPLAQDSSNCSHRIFMAWSRS